MQHQAGAHACAREDLPALRVARIDAVPCRLDRGFAGDRDRGRRGDSLPGATMTLDNTSGGTDRGRTAPAAHHWRQEPNAFGAWLGDHQPRYRAIGEVVVDAAVRESLLHTGHLGVVPGAAVELARIAVASRNDLQRYHERLALPELQMAAVKAFFEHNFIKGLEAAFRHQNRPGERASLAYRWVDVFDRGYVEALPKAVQMYANLGVLALHSVFRALQEAALADAALGFVSGGAARADALAIAFHWASRVGAAMALEKQGQQ
jgi:hypothetical protein